MTTNDENYNDVKTVDGFGNYASWTYLSHMKLDEMRGVVGVIGVAV